MRGVGKSLCLLAISVAATLAGDASAQSGPGSAGPGADGEGGIL